MPRRASLLAAALLFVTAAVWAAPEPTFSPSETIEEEWSAIFVNGTHAGHMRSRTETGRGADGKEIVRWSMTNDMKIARMGLELSVTSESVVHESPETGMRWFSFSIRMGAIGAMLYEGTREGNVLHIRETSMGQTYTREVPWPSGTMSYYEAAKRVEADLQAGKKRFSYAVFEPQTQRVATATYIVEGTEETALLGGESRRLTKIRMEQDIFPDLATFGWADARGKILKMFSPKTSLGIEVTAYVTTKERATRPAEPVELLAQTLVTPDKPIARPRDAKRIVYRVAFRGGKTPAFPSDARQTAKSAGPGIAALDIVRLAPPAGGKPAPRGPEIQKYLAPNAYLQSDDTMLAAEARKLTANLKTEWEKARALNRWVFRHVNKKSLGVGFASAKEVFENPQGDCTEHAMLLAAMLRAVNIPSRVVVGLVYSPEWKAFGYHMWTEALVGNTWHALDPTFDEELVNPTHIKFSDSALDQGISPAFLTEILSFMRNMEIKIVKVEYE